MKGKKCKGVFELNHEVVGLGDIVPKSVQSVVVDGEDPDLAMLNSLGSIGDVVGSGTRRKGLIYPLWFSVYAVAKSESASLNRLRRKVSLLVPLGFTLYVRTQTCDRCTVKNGKTYFVAMAIIAIGLKEKK